MKKKHLIRTIAIFGILAIIAGALLPIFSGGY